MAQNIADVGNARGRGRPKGSKNRPKAGTPGERAAAARQAEEMIEGAVIKGPIPPAPLIEEDVEWEGEDDAVRAPSFGANEPDCSVFLKHVQILRAHAEKEASAKLTVKNLNKQKKDLRQAAKQEGIVLGELDRALKDADTEQVDLEARERRYMLYMEWLGKPINYQAELSLTVDDGDEAEAKRWHRRGDQDGRAGRERKAPEGCPPDRVQDYLHGYDHGQQLLMRSSPLTRSAFDLDMAEQPAAAAPEDDKKKVFVLHEGHFAAGTTLEDANLKTLLPEHRERFEANNLVIAVFAGKKRILKEPGYEDNGEEDCEVTEPEPLEPKELEGFALEDMAAELE